MEPLFPRWMNRTPAIGGAVGVVGALFVIGIVWYYFTPKYWESGYMPTQPIAYSHQLHAGTLGIDCRYCHSHVDKSHEANVPATNVCMNCHEVVNDKQGYLQRAMTLDGSTPSPHWQNVSLQRLRAAHAEGVSPEWRRIHKLPDYVRFNHAAHVNAGVSCYSCHGRIDTMPVVYQEQSLAMAWCLECHRGPEGSLIDTSEMAVTNLRAVAERLSGPHQMEVGARLVDAKGIAPPEHCGACHY